MMWLSSPLLGRYTYDDYLSVIFAIKLQWTAFNEFLGLVGPAGGLAVRCLVSNVERNMVLAARQAPWDFYKWLAMVPGH